MERRQNHAAVAFATDNAAVFNHLQAHVDFAHLRTAETATVFRGDIFVHAARRKVHTNASLLLGEHFVRRDGKRVFLTDTLSQTVHEGAAVGIRVHGKAHRTAVLLHGFTQVAQVLRNRFRTARERAVGFAMHAHHFATELFQQARHNVAARTVHGIHGHLEMLRLDGFHVHERNLERAIDMDAVGIRRDFVLAHRAVIRIGEVVRIGELEKLLHVIGPEEESLVVEELERVPFERVMACGNDDARIRLEMRREEFHRRRRRKADIHHVHAGEAAYARDKLHDGIAGGAAVTPDNDTLRLRNLEEGAHMALEHLRGEGIAHDTADTRNRTHQFRHLVYSVFKIFATRFSATRFCATRCYDRGNLKPYFIRVPERTRRTRAVPRSR